MKIPFATRTLAILVAAALAPLCVSPARADSATGNDTAIGNALNPGAPGVPGGPFAVDPEWLVGQRSPSGFLLDPPRAFPEAPRRTESGWDYRAWVELGGLMGDADERAALFRMYKDLRNGAYANQFGFAAEKPGQAPFVEAWGGAAGRDDQFYGLAFGRYNDWKVKAFYNETPHVFTGTYRSLWTGVGSGSIEIANPAALPPGGGGRTFAQIEQSLGTVLAATPESELSLVRREGGIRLDMRLTETWRAFASFTSEQRKGARPFGSVWGAQGGNGNVEIPEPIDYATHELQGGLQFADALTSLNLQASASYFRNNIDTLTFQSPMAVAPAGGISGVAPGGYTAGRFDLVPGNDYYNAQAEVARAFPAWWNARLTAVASAGTSRQDDALIPYTTLPGIVVNGVAGGQWDTTASLSQPSARARIDSRLVDLGLALSPADALGVKVRYRLHETDNSTDYRACNPLTGQSGRLVNDGSASAIVTSAAGTPPWPVGTQYCNLDTLLAYTAANGNVPSSGASSFRSIPWESRQAQFGATADYRLGRTSSLNALAERETIDRTNRERDRTTEDKLKLGYVHRGLATGTLRLSWEHDRRRGSDYVSDPYVDFVSQSLGALPSFGTAATWVRTVAGLRKYDLADRDQDIANARFILTVVPDVDAAVSAQSRNMRYPDSRYGRTDSRRQDSVGIDVNWRPSTELSGHAYYAWQGGSLSQSAIWPATCTIGFAGVTAANFASLCPTAGGPLYPLDRAWGAVTRERNDTWGFGVRYDLQRALLDVTFLQASGRSRISYDYNAAALAGNISPAERDLAGSGMPDLVTTQSTLEANLLVPVSKTVSLRVLYRHERGAIRDWHYDGVAAAPAIGNAAYLDSGPQDYKADVIGLFLRLEL